jgi:hypothetical protein
MSFKAGDTVRGYEGIGVITHIYEYDGVIDVNFAGDKFNTPSLPESLRRVEVITFWDLCNAWEDVLWRENPQFATDLYGQRWDEIWNNHDDLYLLWRTSVSYGQVPLPAHLAYLYDWTEVRDVVDNAAEG